MSNQAQDGAREFLNAGELHHKPSVFITDVVWGGAFRPKFERTPTDGMQAPRADAVTLDVELSVCVTSPSKHDCATNSDNDRHNLPMA